MSKKYNLKKIDSVTILLWIFILFLMILFAYLIKVNRHIQEFSTYNNSVNELKIINKEFDNFLLQQATFIDFDSINKSIFSFDKNIIFLDSKVSHDMFPSTYKQFIQDVTFSKLIRIISITKTQYYVYHRYSQRN